MPRASLQALNGGKAGYDVDADLVELEAAIAAQLARQNATWLDLFRGANLRRTSVATGVQGVQQGQGLGFLGNYLVVFLIQLGYTNPFEILLILFGLITIFTATGFFTQDFFGRRAWLIGGALVMGASLLAVAISTTVEAAPTGGLSIACIFFIAVWYLTFTQSWSTITWTISTEIPSDVLRDKTLALAAFTGYASNLVITEVSPYIQNAGYGNLGGKIGYIWACMSVVAAVWTYFLVLDLKGKTLEQIDWMFDHGVPLHKMATFVVPEGAIIADKVELDVKGAEVEHEEKV